MVLPEQKFPHFAPVLPPRRPGLLSRSVDVTFEEQPDLALPSSSGRIGFERQQTCGCGIQMACLVMPAFVVASASAGESGGVTAERQGVESAVLADAFVPLGPGVDG